MINQPNATLKRFKFWKHIRHTSINLTGIRHKSCTMAQLRWNAAEVFLPVPVKAKIASTQRIWNNQTKGKKMRSVAELGLFGDSVLNPGLIPSVLPFQLTNEPSSYSGFDFQGNILGTSYSLH
jgi:hypothetical protein